MCLFSRANAVTLISLSLQDAKDVNSSKLSWRRLPGMSGASSTSVLTSSPSKKAGSRGSSSSGPIVAAFEAGKGIEFGKMEEVRKKENCSFGNRLYAWN
jgi:hypothetical protein